MKKYLLTMTVLLIGLFGSIAMPSTALAACNQAASGVQSGLSATGYATNKTCKGTGIQGGITKIAAIIIDILSIIVGIAAVIMIIVSGLRYILSGGESGSVSGAKNTLLYAVVGLIVAVLAQVIVKWVLNYSSAIL